MSTNCDKYHKGNGVNRYEYLVWQLGQEGMTGILGPYPGSCFSLLPVFVQHDAAQLYLTVWNLIKDQITDVDLVSPRTESSEREGAVLVHMEAKRKV